MNILRNYTEKICGFPTRVFNSILCNRNNDYIIENKSINLYIIKNTHTGKLVNLPCVNKIYTTNSNCKAIKIAKNSSHCFNTFKAFDIEPSYNDCIECHKQSLSKLKNKQLKIIKK